MHTMVCWSAQRGVLVGTAWCVNRYSVVCWLVQHGVQTN